MLVAAASQARLQLLHTQPFQTDSYKLLHCLWIQMNMTKLWKIHIHTYICISLINEILATKTKERSHIIWKKSGCTCHLAQEGLEPHLGGWIVYTLPHCSLLPNMRFNFIIILLQSWERVTHLLSVPTESVRPQIIWRSAPLDTLHGNYRERGT